MKSVNIALLLFVTVKRVKSVLIGDEQYGDLEGGRFWTFHSEGISIVNYDSCQVEKTLTQGCPTTTKTRVEELARYLCYRRILPTWA